MPICKSDSDIDRCNWYIACTKHAAGCSIYWHLYNVFHPETSNYLGWMCGHDTALEQFNLPGQFEPHINKWNSMIFNTIYKPRVFQDNSQVQSIFKINHLEGYKCILVIISVNHPAFCMVPARLICNRPFQQQSKTIVEYHFWYLDYLYTQAFIQNIDINLGNE